MAKTDKQTHFTILSCKMISKFERTYLKTQQRFIRNFLHSNAHVSTSIKWHPITG